MRCAGIFIQGVHLTDKWSVAGRSQWHRAKGERAESGSDRRVSMGNVEKQDSVSSDITWTIGWNQSVKTNLNKNLGSNSTFWGSHIKPTYQQLLRYTFTKTPCVADTNLNLSLHSESSPRLSVSNRFNVRFFFLWGIPYLSHSGRGRGREERSKGKEKKIRGEIRSVLEKRGGDD